LDANAVHPRASQHPLAAARCPRVATDLPAAYKYPSPLSTLQIVGVVLDGKMSQFIFKLSKLLLASSLALVIE